MDSAVRALSALAIIIGAALTAALTWSISTFAPLAAVTALMMGGVGHPLLSPDTDDFVADYLRAMGDNYVQPALDRWSTPADPLTLSRRVAVYTPEQFWPVHGPMSFDESVAMGVTNLSACISGEHCLHNSSTGDAPAYEGLRLVFGYSESARIATVAKRELIEFYQRPGIDWAGAPQVVFVVIGNPGRPNGGVLQRFHGLSIPLLGVTFDGATPTDSTDSTGTQRLLTLDITKQYDGVSDFPLYPLNLLATVNALAGFFTEHGSYLESLDDASVVDQGSHGDTHYYLIPTRQLPMLKPLNGIVPAPMLTAVEAPLRTIVELGYDRTLSPGVPARVRLLRIPSVTDGPTVLRAVATGIDDGLTQAVADPTFRPLGTTPATGPFGVPRWGSVAPGDDSAVAEVDSEDIEADGTVGPDVDAVGEAAETPGRVITPVRERLRDREITRGPKMLGDRALAETALADEAPTDEAPTDEAPTDRDLLDRSIADTERRSPGGIFGPRERARQVKPAKTADTYAAPPDRNIHTHPPTKKPGKPGLRQRRESADARSGDAGARRDAEPPSAHRNHRNHPSRAERSLDNSSSVTPAERR